MREYKTRGPRLTMGQAGRLEKKEKESQKLSRIDSLTGLLNRRGFEEQVNLLLPLADREHLSMSLLAIDLDGLRGFNNTLGHPEGDRLIIDTANILRGFFRETDLLGRYGGDEIMILMVGSDSEVVEQRAEKLRLLFEEKKKSGENVLTISGGITTYEPKEGYESLYSRVDELLYGAKNGGRNQIWGSERRVVIEANE